VVAVAVVAEDREETDDFLEVVTSSTPPVVPVVMPVKELATINHRQMGLPVVALVTKTLVQVVQVETVPLALVLLVQLEVTEITEIGQTELLGVLGVLLVEL
tara:strand:- start:53 stop:358 length:306 start_codon:yes stop_codon:yes gene_type:complete